MEMELQPILWSDEFAIGIQEIDDQHRRLVDMINALESGKDGGGAEATGKVLAQLNDYVRDHFMLEERLMEDASFDADFVTRHHGEHAYFRGALKDFTADFENGRREVSASLIEYLVHWLLHHIVVVDRDMARQFHAAGPELATHFQALAQGLTDNLVESERHLIADLQHANAALARQLEELRREHQAVLDRLEASKTSAGFLP